MLKIGICDMDDSFVEFLLEKLQKVLSNYSKWESETFDSCRDVLERIKAGTFDCNLLFMDIAQNPDESHNLAQYIEKHHVNTDVIYITASKDHVFKCYRQNTYAYLLKPLKEKDLTTEIERYLKEIKYAPKCLNINIMGVNKRIPLDVIEYIESNYRKVIVHTKQCNYEYYDKLDSVDEILKGDGFIRCHQSYLVPKNRILSFNSTMIQLDGISIPISRRYKDDVRKILTEEEINSTIIKKNIDKKGQSYISSGLFQQNDTKGALVCVEGKYLGKIARFVPEQKIVVGRDNLKADLVVNLPLVSRTHCTIIYHEKEDKYEVTDNSTNGTYIDGGVKLIRGNTYLLSPKCNISFGDRSAVYKFG